MAPRAGKRPRFRLASCLASGEAGLYMQALSGFCASAMGCMAKVMGQDMGVPIMAMVLCRSLSALALSLAMLARAPGAGSRWPWRSSRRWMLLLRGVLGFGVVVCQYGAVQLLPLSDVAVLSLLTPLFVALLAPLVLGEGTRVAVMAMALPLSMAGVLLVAKPTVLFGGSAEPLSDVGVVLGVLQALMLAGVKLTVRTLGATESTGSIILALAVVSVAGAGSLGAALPGQWPTGAALASAWALLAGTAVLSCAVQYFSTLALKVSRAAPTTAMNYLLVVWGILFDVMLYGRHPTRTGLMGAALVSSGALVIIAAERGGGGGGGSSSSGMGLRDKQSSGVPLSDMSPDSPTVLGSPAVQHRAHQAASAPVPSAMAPSRSAR